MSESNKQKSHVPWTLNIFKNKNNVRVWLKKNRRDNRR